MGTVEKNLIMICFNGMNFNMIEGNATHEDLRKVAHRRIGQGYDVTWLNPNEIEVNSDGLVNDHMGYVKLITVKPKTFKCFECGCEVVEGELCCNELE